ncbi:hypothetical protein [Cohnella sp. AR92]|uniref:WYL domain-containing protein n=1 Tax=Cohnella sp. AR92 TaxID=648716 RepID=UPI000F8C4E1C|nr:hypothetical protein [Cohnella sp. AR92]RUS42260.1 hypothetical protein ELR57_26975 [Cohnella sp. AR92]
MSIEKFIGRRVEVIYQNGKGELSQRVVTVHSVTGGRARVFDCDKQAFRTFSLDRILAVMPTRRAS